MNPTYRKFLGWCRTLHVYLTMLVMIAILFFAATGFILNHPDWFGLNNSHVKTSTVQVPTKLLAEPDKLAIVEFLRKEAGASGENKSFEEDSEGAITVAFEGPGKQVTAIIQKIDGKTEVSTDQTILSVLTELHRAKHSGKAWPWVLDITALMLVIGTLTGLILFLSLPKRRKLGFSALGVGTLAAVLIYYLFVP